VFPHFVLSGRVLDRTRATAGYMPAAIEHSCVSSLVLWIAPAGWTTPA